jgi:AcrR family transcriptional regulator
MGISAERRGGRGERRIGRAQRRDDMRRRLLQAVQRLTAGEESYADISIERLATEAGLSRATFYTYFEGKADLLGAWFAETLEELHQAFGPWLERGSSLEELRKTIERVVMTFREHATLIAAINDEAMQDFTLREQWGNAIQSAIDGMQTHIELGQKEGWIDPELLPAETAAWLVWLLERGLNQVIVPSVEDRLAALVETLATMSWQILYADAPTRRDRG